MVAVLCCEAICRATAGMLSDTWVPVHLLLTLLSLSSLTKQPPTTLSSASCLPPPHSSLFPSLRSRARHCPTHLSPSLSASEPITGYRNRWGTAPALPGPDPS